MRAREENIYKVLLIPGSTDMKVFETLRVYECGEEDIEFFVNYHRER